MLAYYGHPLSENRLETEERYLICRNVPIARTGKYLYTAGELGLDGDPERAVEVWRDAEEVFSPAAMASFEGKPVTDNHPPENVGPANHGAYARGHAQNIRRDGDFLLADLYINDSTLAEEIRSNTKREVSCGYLCTYEPDGGRYRQTHIRGNHIAVVPAGRAGHEVAIKDSAPRAEKRRDTPMSKLSHAILSAFGMAAKDASTEELPGLIRTASDALDATLEDKAPEEAQKEKTPEAKPADEMVEKAPKGDDLGSKLDRILAILEAEKEHRKEKKPAKDGEKDRFRDLLRLLGGAEAPVIPADDGGCKEKAGGSVMDMIRKMRPAVAAITDDGQRERVADALLSCLPGKEVMEGLLSAAQDSAQGAADKAPASFEQLCQAQKAAYDARNPHKQKEEK